MVLLIIASLCLLLASKNGSLDCSAPAHYVLMLGNERRPRPGKIGPTFAQQTQNMLHKRQKDIKFFFLSPNFTSPTFCHFPHWSMGLATKKTGNGQNLSFYRLTFSKFNCCRQNIEHALSLFRHIWARVDRRQLC